MSQTQIPQTQAPASPPAQAERVQATLSIVGDVSVAASDALERLEEGPRRTAWKPILAFCAMVYTASVGAAWLLPAATPRARLLLIPVLPVLCATAAFWWRQKWKFRTLDSRFRLKIWQDALQSLGHEAANAANAMRANLIGFRLANPQSPGSEHLDEIELGTRRIDAVVQRAQNPVAWKGAKKQTAESPAAEVGEQARSSIAL